MFRDVPLATLAAILIFVALRLFRVRDLVAIARFSVWEFALAAVTFLTVALVGVEQGIGVALGLAILERMPQPLGADLSAGVTTVTAEVEVEADTDAIEQLPLANGAPTHLIVE